MYVTCSPNPVGEEEWERLAFSWITHEPTLGKTVSRGRGSQISPVLNELRVEGLKKSHVLLVKVLTRVPHTIHLKARFSEGRTRMAALNLF